MTATAASLDFLSQRFKLLFDLQITPMLPTMFQVNWPFGSGEEAKNRFSRWPPWRPFWISDQNNFSYFLSTKKVREKSKECHNHKPLPFPDPKRKRKPTNLNKHKPNKRPKSTKISSLFPKRGNRNTKRTEKHKNKMTHGKTYNKSPRRINTSHSDASYQVSSQSAKG